MAGRFRAFQPKGTSLLPNVGKGLYPSSLTFSSRLLKDGYTNRSFRSMAWMPLLISTSCVTRRSQAGEHKV